MQANTTPSKGNRALITGLPASADTGNDEGKRRPFRSAFAKATAGRMSIRRRPGKSGWSFLCLQALSLESYEPCRFSLILECRLYRDLREADVNVGLYRLPPSGGRSNCGTPRVR